MLFIEIAFIGFTLDEIKQCVVFFGTPAVLYGINRIFGIRAGARTLIGGGGGEGCIFIYSGYARLISFEINFITKETSRAEPEYMNIHPPPPN